MTWQEFQYEYRAMPLHLMNVEHLARLSAFTPSILGPEERIDFEEAKRVIRDELATRRNRSERQEEVVFRRMERHRTDQQHDEHVNQSSRMHITQMERAHASFVLHRRSIWLAAGIAVISALLAWSSLWTQRKETRQALDALRERMDALEARGRVLDQGDSFIGEMSPPKNAQKSASE
ncbi:hypothetical protein [Roseimicrobium sp. ORNL1]|uniref:hypothetical protein n=1 Tax=Roseimicrobium sp. ORNL1 TaxID=2711231 RepID=UPI0013E0FD3B|nr:hypothetical protein [Roseimicrobium sp. ORNL1]QIF01860.1 hypothetical protein G5S37_10080 [Roseimicrobium sp. ORNL1]